MANDGDPPNNCPVCLLVQQQESYVSRLPNGLVYLGINFHIHDFVLIQADKGPSHVGHIMDIRFPGKSYRRRSPKITVKLLGRISSLGRALPLNIVKDEVSDKSYVYYGITTKGFLASPLLDK